MIEVHHLTKTFKDKKRGVITAVSDVSFTCQPGRIYGLLGANGAGKTTTLRMLATLLKPAGGTVRVAGHDAATAPEPGAGPCRLPRGQHRALRASHRPRNDRLFWRTQRHE